MTSPRWPVVLFDLDGTLADTIRLILGSYAHATREVLGEAASVEESRSWIGRPLIDSFGERYPGHVDALYEAYVAWNLDNLDRLIESYHGVEALLADLAAAGVRTGIVTSKRRVSADRTLAAVGLTGAIDVLVAMEDTDTHKPGPEPLVLALGIVGRPASDAVYIGDAIFDLQAADAAGMDAVGVTWGAGVPGDLRAQPSVAVVDAVADLRALLLP